MSTTFTGPITDMGTIETGTTKSGKEWRKREFVIEHESGNYPKIVSMAAMNSACDHLDQFDVGDVVQVEVSVESRKSSSGKYYTNINCFKVSRG